MLLCNGNHKYYLLVGRKSKQLFQTLELSLYYILNTLTFQCTRWKIIPRIFFCGQNKLRCNIW